MEEWDVGTIKGKVSDKAYLALRSKVLTLRKL